MKTKNIFIAGHKGLVGSSINKFLSKKKDNIVTKNREELDLLNQSKVLDFFKKQKIDQVYLAAAKVGGIYANNTYPAEFIYENLMIQTNIIHSSFLCGVKKLLFIGSSCIYPKNAKQPIKESELFNGKLEPTNEPYAVAKIAGIKMCESYNRQYSNSHGIDYRSIMPTNLYGPHNTYHPENSHVIAALISRFHDAKIKKLPKVIIWGTGKPKREFLYVDDMTKAAVHIMNLDKKIYYKLTKHMCSHINVGFGTDITIKELAENIREIVGFEGSITFDTTQPDGTPRKLLNSEILRDFGYKPKVSLKDGLAKTYKDYIEFNADH
ncbi:GDP-L-fucose synthase [Candidatus Pelagibacter sp.]|nr:GDP-L-fucose synthase [Candidatus Pelagibacter sp.]